MTAFLHRDREAYATQDYLNTRKKDVFAEKSLTPVVSNESSHGERWTANSVKVERRAPAITISESNR